MSDTNTTDEYEYTMRLCCNCCLFSLFGSSKVHGSMLVSGVNIRACEPNVESCMGMDAMLHACDVWDHMRLPWQASAPLSGYCLFVNCHHLRRGMALPPGGKRTACSELHLYSISIAISQLSLRFMVTGGSDVTAGRVSGLPRELRVQSS